MATIRLHAPRCTHRSTIAPHSGATLMSLIIDGYNLMYAAGIAGRGLGPGRLERCRLALLNFVVESADPRELPKTVVVFDGAGAPPGLPQSQKHRGLTVQFARADEDADTLIEELIRRDSAPRQLTVVSSDHRLQRAARRRRSRAIDSEKWYAEALKQRRQRSRRPSGAGERKPAGPLSDTEVAYWLAEFGEDATLADDLANDAPFPPGYADDESAEE